MNRSENITSLAAALCAFQADVKNVKKDAVNPFFKSKYASLDSIWDEVRPLLKNHKLALTQFPSGDGELTSILLHESGEFIEVSAKMSIKEHTPQGQGSAITYMRRYAMSSILGIVTEEDDDGNEASKPAIKVAAPKAPTATVGGARANAPANEGLTAPCDNIDCKGIAKLQFGKFCYNCGQHVKKGGTIAKLRSEGAVSEEEVPMSEIPF
jgi:hypothetical protein